MVQQRDPAETEPWNQTCIRRSYKRTSSSGFVTLSPLSSRCLVNLLLAMATSN